MVRVNNRKTISNIGKKSLSSNKIRNIVAILAIALTTILFTALFTIGGSLVETIQNGTMRQVGTSAHGGYKFLTQPQYDTLVQDQKIKDISYNIIVGLAENPELNKTYTEIRWTEEDCAKWGWNLPTTGKLPESGMELATTTAVLDALGVPHKLGETVHLEFTADEVKHSDDFTLCGFWDTDIALAANQAFVSREYSDRVAPVKTVPLYEQPELTDTSYMAGTINPSLWFSTSLNISGQMNALSERCGFDTHYVNDGVNWAYATNSVDFQFIAVAVVALLLIGGSGYLIIYNVFYISVANDVRFFGLLKTIGTTGKQLKRIVRKQAFLLSIVGIPLGLLLGYLCGRVVMPAVMGGTTMSGNYVISINPFIFLGATLFSLITVWVSCIKPCKSAAKVSPIEAVRFTNTSKKAKRHAKRSSKVTALSMANANLKRDKRKTVLVVLSLSLSMILLNSTYTIVKGFDMEKFLENKVVSDFFITDASILNYMSTQDDFEGVTPSTLEYIKNLPGLEGMGSTYMKESEHKLSNEAYEKAQVILEKNRELLPGSHSDDSLLELEQEHTMSCHLYGADEFVFDKLKLAEDTPLDKEKFMSGDYVIATAFFTSGKDRYYDVGDKVTIDFQNGNSKEYEVLAIGDIPRALGPRHSHCIDIYFTLPANEYHKQLGETQPLCTAFDVDDAHIDDTEKQVKDYCENIDSNMDYNSRETYVQSFHNEQMMFIVVGGVLSIILGLIGILNFLNALITSVIARRHELAMLQSVGMTKKQVKKMLVFEGLSYAGITALFTITLGTPICYLIVHAIAADMWFFTYHFTVLPIAIITPIFLLISFIMPIIIYHFTVKKSIVERLRVVE